MLCIASLLVAGGCGTVQDQARDTGATAAGSSTPAGGTAVATGGTLMLGVMVHVEGWHNEAQDQAAFAQHAGMVRQYGAIFERYGLPLTFEFSPEFVHGCINWKDNVIKEMADKGHGIGIHADLGGEPGLTQQRFVSGLVTMKKDIESLGVQVRHVSGICSSLDWVKAAQDAGFLFVTGTVEYALKSIPADKLPEQYRSVLSVSNPSQAHGNVPYELAERLRPWRMASGATWLWNDPQGKVVIIPGDGGMCIPWMADGAGGKRAGQKSTLSAEDVTAFTAEVDKAIALSDPAKVNALYVGWSVGAKVDAAAVDAWAKAIKGYTDAGKAQWKTLPGIYDAFIAWEAGR